MGTATSPPRTYSLQNIDNVPLYSFLLSMGSQHLLCASARFQTPSTVSHLPDSAQAFSRAPHMYNEYNSHTRTRSTGHNVQQTDVGSFEGTNTYKRYRTRARAANTHNLPTYSAMRCLYLLWMHCAPHVAVYAAIERDSWSYNRHPGANPAYKHQQHGTVQHTHALVTFVNTIWKSVGLDRDCCARDYDKSCS